MTATFQLWVATIALVLVSTVAYGQPLDRHGYPAAVRTYRDSISGVIFYVESDGRHLVALDPTGKLLWVRDPFVDSGLPPYRTPKPVIFSISPTIGWMKQSCQTSCITVQFDSSQTGVVDMTTGDFAFVGQD